MLVLFQLFFLFYFVFLLSCFILVSLPLNLFIGYGTTHKVNNLLIQNGEHFGSSTEVRSPTNKRSRRSFNAEYETCSVQHIFLQNARKEADFDQFQNLVVLAECNMNDFLSVFLTWDSVPEQVIPGWTGFNIIVQDGIVVLKSSVSYLDFVRVPATELNTIYQV